MFCCKIGIVLECQKIIVTIGELYERKNKDALYKMHSELEETLPTYDAKITEKGLEPPPPDITFLVKKYKLISRWKTNKELVGMHEGKIKLYDLTCMVELFRKHSPKKTLSQGKRDNFTVIVDEKDPVIRGCVALNMLNLSSPKTSTFMCVGKSAEDTAKLLNSRGIPSDQIVMYQFGEDEEPTHYEMMIEIFELYEVLSGDDKKTMLVGIRSDLADTILSVIKCHRLNNIRLVTN